MGGGKLPAHLGLETVGPPVRWLQLKRSMVAARDGGRMLGVVPRQNSWGGRGAAVMSAVMWTLRDLKRLEPVLQKTSHKVVDWHICIKLSLSPTSCSVAGPLLNLSGSAGGTWLQSQLSLTMSSSCRRPGLLNLYVWRSRCSAWSEQMGDSQTTDLKNVQTVRWRQPKKAMSYFLVV